MKPTRIDITVVQICLLCLRGFTRAGRTQCPTCASVVRYLAVPIAADQFAELDLESRADLKLAPKARAVA
jgi:hypothetical protein